MTKIYLVAEGVSFVDGGAVPDSREVALTDKAAQFDLSLGRIAEKPAAPEPEKRSDARRAPR